MIFNLFRRRPPVDPGPAFSAVILRLREDLAAERAARAFAMQRLYELKLEHARETEDLRRRLAVSQANFEWLSVAFNQAQTERSTLLLRSTNVASAPIVVGVAPGAPPEVQPEDFGSRPPVVERPYSNRGTPDLSDLTSQGLSFDDVGNREASALGLDQGQVYDPATIPFQ